MSSAHSLTTAGRRRLLAACAASLALHGLPVLPELLVSPTERPSTVPPLRAELRPPPPAADVPLSLPEPSPPRPIPAPKKMLPKPAASRPATWTQAVRDHLRQRQERGEFYPPEAIARGLQGEVLVLIVVDESGQVVGARVEHGSGHAILDAAALQAVRSLKSLPADAPRQIVLPVVFRLR
ncbi:energy transducer TonB [Azonexus sp.]|uniref:energy transducer TonB n=1 Tax=Azonexus sp. TaxID=1872668 RepID=UPI0035B4001B